MATVTQTFTGTGSWVCPNGVTQATAECWGGGGTGGPATGNPARAGGGAGGQYAIKVVTGLTPGTTYTVTVGAASTAQTATVVAGNDSWFNTSGTVIAKGGAGGANATGTSGLGGAGSTTSGIGDTVRAGGSGGAGVAAGTSGGGGGGAGSTGTGASGSSGTQGGATSLNGGAGGAGLTSGTQYRAGGNGAQGLVILTWDDGFDARRGRGNKQRPWFVHVRR